MLPHCVAPESLRSHHISTTSEPPTIAFLTQTRLFPHKLVPAVDPLSDTITVVRRPFKVGNMRTYGQRRVEMTKSFYITPAWEFTVLSPPYLRHAWDYLPRFHPGHVRSWAGALEGGREIDGSGWSGAKLLDRGPVLEADCQCGRPGCPSCS